MRETHSRAICRRGKAFLMGPERVYDPQLSDANYEDFLGTKALWDSQRAN